MKHFLFDAHSDTASRLLDEKQSLRKNYLQWDLERLQNYDRYLQVFAAFIDQKELQGSPFSRCVAVLSNLQSEIQKNETEIMLIKSKKDLETFSACGKAGAILSIEGGEALEGEFAKLKKFYEMGVRLITLTWNYANEIADGIGETRGRGLTDFGRRTVLAMQELGMLIDVSHLSPKGFWDVASITDAPFLASHSCAKSLCPHPRNLDDAQIRCLIERKGGIGLNFYSAFLTEKEECTMDDILRHMEYILSLGGEEILGFGSDFDGVDRLPEGILGVESVVDIVRAMQRKGFSDATVRAICYGNFYRLFSDVLK